MAAPKPPKQSKEQSIKEYWAALKLLFTNPLKFYGSVTKETGYRQIIFKYAIFVAVLQAFLFLVGLYSNIKEDDYLVLTSFLVLLLRIGFAFAVPFIAAGVVHLGVLMFKGKKDYYTTFKPIAYSLFISIIYGSLATLVYEIINTFLPAPIIVESISEIMPHFVSGVVIGVIGMIHVLYTQTIGISYYHQLSKIKAFLAVIIVPLIVVLFFSILMFWLATMTFA